MCRLLESVLAKIEHEAIEASLHAKACKSLLQQAEALQKLLVDHGCRHAEPEFLRYGGVIIYDYTHDGSMINALHAAGLTIIAETTEPDSIGSGSVRHLQLAEFPEIRMWIHYHYDLRQIPEAA